MEKRRKSIQKELLLYFCILIFSSVVILAVILSLNTSKVVLDYTGEEIFNGLRQAEHAVDDRLTQSIECFSSVMLDDTITHTMKMENDIDTSTGFAKADKVSRTLRLLKQSYPYVSAIYIYDNKNKCYYHSENTVINELQFGETDLYHKLIAQEDYLTWKAFPAVPGMSWDGEKGYLTCALPLKEHITKEILGYVFISVDIGEIFKYIEDFEIINSGELFWLSADNQLLDSAADLPEEALTAIKTDRGRGAETSVYIRKLSKYLYTRQSGDTGMKYGMLIPYQNMKSPGYQIWKLALICMLPILGMAFYLSYVFSKKMYRPMKILVGHMEKAVIVEHDRTLIKEVRDDEFGVLYASFNQMIIENGRLLDEQKLILLRLFQEQINPHFLYNTLNSIYCLSNLYHIKEIADLSEALTNFYRLSLNSGRDMITVRNTIQHIQHYIRIQNVRYRGRYKLEINADEELLEAEIPKLIVQPLVENAIEHGLKDTADVPVIWLAFCRDGCVLVITITDRGCGIQAERLREITEILDGDIDDKEQIFALKNIYDRIKLYYGRDGSLSIDSEAGRGTVIEIKIPLQKEEV